MNFNDHSSLSGQHAFLSGSSYHWIGYSEEKLVSSYVKALATKRGLELHNLARQLINAGIKLPRSGKALNQYVNDAIGYRMTTEQVLYYSPNAFGTADAICFRNNFLRIHDLKTGVSRVSIKQLEVYTALFCLEYLEKPDKIEIELRIYQLNDVFVHTPNPLEIKRIMDLIVSFDKRIEELQKSEELWLT